jgi:hypothetical protein
VSNAIAAATVNMARKVDLPGERDKFQRQVVFWRDRRAGLKLISSYLYIMNDLTSCRTIFRTATRATTR